MVCVAYPELRARGYDKPFVVGALAAGGTLGVLIPPSLSLLLYGAIQGVSIGQLFLAEIGPGLMLAAAILVGFTWGDLTWARLVEALVKATTTFGTVLFRRCRCAHPGPSD